MKWVPIPRRHLRPILLLLGLFLLQWGLLFVPGGPTWDAAFYYAFARSMAYDGDLALENDLQLGYPTASPDFVAKDAHTDRTATGRVHSPFAIGSSLLWAPLLGVLRALPGEGVAPGYEWPMVAAVAAFSALSGSVAFALAYRFAAGELNKATALAATVIAALSTPLLYYQFREPLYSHASAALVTTAVVYLWWKRHEDIPHWTEAAVLGVAIGASGLVRWQNLMYLALPAISIAWAWLLLDPLERKRSWQRALAALAAAGIAALVVFSIQSSVWEVFYGSPLTVPQGGAYVDWRAPFIGQVLFSPFRGLLHWMPLFFASVAGLLFLLRKRPRLVIPLLLVLLLETYVNASTRDWFAGGGFGPRRYTSELAILVLGLAGLLATLPARLRAVSVPVLGVLLGLHQWILLRYGLIERIGGRVTSMYPTYGWLENTPTGFWQQVLAHAPDALREPASFWVFAGSPLDRLIVPEAFPERHVVGLLLASLFTLLVAVAIRRVAPTGATRFKAWWLAAAAVVILLLDVWILFLA